MYNFAGLLCFCYWRYNGYIYLLTRNDGCSTLQYHTQDSNEIETKADKDQQGPTLDRSYNEEHNVPWANTEGSRGLHSLDNNGEHLLEIMAAKWLASEAADDEVDDTETKARAYYCQTCDK